MAEDNTIYGFDKEDAARIAKITPWSERQMNAGFSQYGPTKAANPVTLYARLTEKDAGGPGLWSAEEVIFQDNLWAVVPGGYTWDGSTFPYCHHYSWSGATVEQIVKMYKTTDHVSGSAVWVFDTDLGNPEVFQFYSDDNGSSSECKDLAKVWKMPEAGKVMTNVGTLQVAEPFELNPGMMCVCVCRFVDFGYGLELASADLIERPLGDPGTYWDNSSAGEIFVRIPIASVSTAAGVARLEQHHAGDIRIEMFGFAEDEDSPPDEPIPPYNFPVRVVGDDDWIHVKKAGNTYTVNHILPDPALPQNSFKALDAAFDCSDVNFSSVSDVTDWVNDTLLANIKKLFYDQRGHIYQREDCDGNVEEYTPTEDPTTDILNSTLSEVENSRVVPEDVSSTFAFDFVYKVFNKGANYTDLIADGKKIVLGVTNGLGQKVRYSYVAGGPYGTAVLQPAENVDGTSGLDKDVYFDTNFFRFNDTFPISVAVPGPGLPQNSTIDSETCTATLNTTTTIIRDKTDPNAAAFSVSVTYSVTNLGSATVPTISDTLTNGPYCTGLYFKYSDGQRVSWSYQGANGPFSTATRFLELDNTSQTGVFSNIYFDLRDDVTDDVDFDLAESGVVVDMCTELLATDSLYNANVDQCELLSVMSESDCVTDGEDDVTDDSGECLTGGGVTYTDAWFSVATSGLNQWAILKPWFDVGEFSENALPNKTEFGYSAGPGETTCYTGYHLVPAGTTNLTLDYNWYKYSGADSATFIFVISNTRPTTGASLKTMTDSGISLTPNSSDFTTTYNIDLTAALAFVDTNKDMYIAIIQQFYYDGDDPSTWPDAASNGGGTWVQAVTYYET